MMALLSFLLAVSGAGISPDRILVQEVKFEAARYCLPFFKEQKFSLQAPDTKLIWSAIEDSEAEGRKITFQTAIARSDNGRAFYAFRLKRYFDIYIVYETDSDRKRWIRKFRYSGKARRCTLPWPPES